LGIHDNQSGAKSFNLWLQLFSEKAAQTHPLRGKVLQTSSTAIKRPKQYCP